MFPHPLLTIALVLFWLLLNGFSPGQMLLGTIVAIFASWAMTALRPNMPSIRKWHLLFKLLGLVFVDIVRSNIGTASVILRGRSAGTTSQFLLMPLEIRDRTALTLLAIIITSTPGSAWLEYDSRDNTVLIHVLDVTDADGWMDEIRKRYEKVLLEIFG